MTIRARLVASFAVLVAFLLVLGGSAWWGGLSQQRAFDRFSQETVASLALVDEVWAGILNSRRHEKDMVLLSGFGQQVLEQRKLWEAQQVGVGRLLGQLGAVGGGEGSFDGSADGRDDGGRRAAAARIEAAVKLYAGKARPTFDGAAAGTINNSGEALAALKPAVDAALDAEAMIQAWRLRLRDSSQRMADDMAAKHRQETWFIVAVLAASVGATVMLGLSVGRSIVVPVVEATRFAAKVGRGDLRAELAPRGDDEVARLGHSLLGMQASLRELVARLSESIESIGTATAEIAVGNQDLADRTEQTAADLQQTSSTISELTAAVQQSADSARLANELATSASQLATRGGDMVSEVVGTMNHIQQTSRKIAEITGVVDGIAFQTNILALNAAVEAARAGEQGRGFAVVAGEVRSLAQRSADAAKEIRSLILASVEGVENGGRLVSQAGGTMEEIVDSVCQVSRVIGDISRASAGLADGIVGVNRSVARLDGMTQQNAALVEQGAAAAESLRDQSVQISALVHDFRTE